MIQKIISTLTLACLLASTSTMHCSEQPQKKDHRPLMHKVLCLGGVVLIGALIAADPLHATKAGLPTNPVDNLAINPTIDTECFSYSYPMAGGKFSSNYYGPANITEATELVQKKYGAQAKVHPRDCLHINPKPFDSFE